LITVYERQTAIAGGAWHSYVTCADDVLVADDADRVLPGYSVQKLAVAVAVLEQVDRGRLDLGQTVELTTEVMLGGSGLFALNPVGGDRLTLATVLIALLLVSDNTAVRLCGSVCPTASLNDVLAAKGFEHTRVEPGPTPHRFFLGTTTPRETHFLLRGLADGTLLSAPSCAFLRSILTSTSGYHDGIRRDLSSAERRRVATKHGADFNTLGAARHEVGIMWGPRGTTIYAFFADQLDDRDDYGGTHPAVRAHAALGRALFDGVTAGIDGR
jgi:beta-lactamase class A